MMNKNQGWHGLGFKLLPLVIAGLCVPLVLTADGQDQQDAGASLPPEALKMIESMTGKSAGGEDADKPFKDFDEVVKDMKATEGLFTIYRYDAADKKHDAEKVLCKIPRGVLNEDLLFAASISRGGTFTGWMWTDHLVRWEIIGKNLKMVTPETRYVHKEGQPVTDAVKRTYGDTYIAVVPIETMTPGGDPVIDLGKLLKSNVANVSFMAGPGSRVRADLSKWTKVKVFPDNVLLDVDLAMSSLIGSGGSSLGVSYAFRRLPKLGTYKPRAADDRVGYFLTARMDWSKKAGARDTFERYVNRWKLEKRDPSLELSPPKKPIVFFIEKTVPIRWRRWIRQGIEDWNKAYEKIGFTDAIIVHQQTADTQFANYDPEDARYNFFRWIVSGRAFAMGPSRTDPRTGQILDADIIMDDAFARAWMFNFDVYAPGSIAAMKGPAFSEWMQDNQELASILMPQWDRDPIDLEETLIKTAEAKLRQNGHDSCSYAFGMQQQMSFIHNALIATASGKKIPERFIGEAIREVVTHEVGHTLGLRHNFKGSSWLGLDEIKRRRDETDEPTSASVMDYNPLLFFEGDTAESVRHFMTPTIGPYDYWAIEYGYGTPDQGDSEEKMLEQIATRCTEEGLAYATDEDTLWVFSPDPLVNRFDNSADPVEWAKSRIKLCDNLAANLTEWSVREGEPRYHLRRAFDQLWFEKARNFQFVGRLVGGQYFHRDHIGDPDARPAFVLVDPDRQREALDVLKRTVLSDSFYKFDAELLNQLAPSRWSHWGSRLPRRLDYAIHERILGLQLVSLFDLITPAVMQRVYDAELKSTADNKFTAAELITSVRDHVFGPLEKVGKGPYTDSKPFLSSIRRNLQKSYLTLMLINAEQSPGSNGMSADLHGMVRFSLRELSGKIGYVLEHTGKTGGGSTLDFASRGHLTECRSRIDRVLNAQFQAK